MVSVQLASRRQFLQEIFNLFGRKITPINYITVFFNLSQELFRVGTNECIFPPEGKEDLPGLYDKSLLFGQVEVGGGGHLNEAKLANNIKLG